MRERIERYGNCPLERVLDRHKCSVHSARLRCVQTLSDIAEANDLAVEPLPRHEIERRRLAVGPHGTEHAHFLSHTHSSYIVFYHTICTAR